MSNATEKAEETEKRKLSSSDEKRKSCGSKLLKTICAKTRQG
jgi:hypothetical protein